jgi:hypothetical protein
MTSDGHLTNTTSKALKPNAFLLAPADEPPRQLRLALEEVQDNGHRGGLFGRLLALGDAEQDHLEAVVAEQGAAQYASVGRLSAVVLLVEDVRAQQGEVLPGVVGESACMKRLRRRRRG